MLNKIKKGLVIVEQMIVKFFLNLLTFLDGGGGQSGDAEGIGGHGLLLGRLGGKGAVAGLGLADSSWISLERPILSNNCSQKWTLKTIAQPDVVNKSLN